MRNSHKDTLTLHQHSFAGFSSSSKHLLVAYKMGESLSMRICGAVMSLQVPSVQLLGWQGHGRAAMRSGAVFRASPDVGHPEGQV